MGLWSLQLRWTIRTVLFTLAARVTSANGTLCERNHSCSQSSPASYVSVRLSCDQSVELWSVQLDGKVVRVCQITRDGSKLFVAGECSQIVVVDLTPSLPRLAGTVAVSVLAIYSLAISRDGRHCFAGADNGSILHIDVNEMKVLKTLQAHAAGVTCINVISKDGSSIVSGTGAYPLLLTRNLLLLSSN